MNHFERIHIQGFRRLYDVDLKLKPLNVMIGANGSGKTSLLDVFTLLSASAEGELKKTLNGLGGVENNLTNLAGEGICQCSSFSFELSTLVMESRPFEYHVSIVSRGAGYAIQSEQGMFSGGGDFLESIYKHEDYSDCEDASKSFRASLKYETALSQLPALNSALSELRERMASVLSYYSLDVSHRSPVRLPQPLQDVQLPGENGEDLVSCLYAIRENDPDRFETIQYTLRAGFPRFERLNFPPVAAGMLAMTWKEETSERPFYMHQLSEGTLRFLWLVTLLNSPGLPAITMIDEPEVSLHPELLAVLVDVMREASQRTQLFVATHSDRLIRYLRPEEVLTIDLDENGAAQMTWADELDLDEWLAEYTLDEVWRMGRMGGRS